MKWLVGLVGCSFLLYDIMSKLQSVHTAGYKDINNVRYYTRSSAVNPFCSLMEGIQCFNKNSWPMCQTNSLRPSTAAFMERGVCGGDTVVPDPEDEANPVTSTESSSSDALLHCPPSVSTLASDVGCEFSDNTRDTVYPVATGMNIGSMRYAVSIVSMISTVHTAWAQCIWCMSGEYGVRAEYIVHDHRVGCVNVCEFCAWKLG